MTTHRTLQIHNLLDTAESKARVCRTGSANLARIGNVAGSAFQLRRAQRFESIAERCKGRLAKGEMKLEELRASQRVWDDLARQEEQMALFYEKSGFPYGNVDSYWKRAEVYRRTSTAIEMQIETGVAVCSCCFKPFGRAA